jgi:Cellulose biosynthesis protein BcsS
VASGEGWHSARLRCCRAVAVAVAVTAPLGGAGAQEHIPWFWIVAPEYQWEVYGGAEMTGQSWSLYSGATYAFFSDVRFNGWRLRSASGLGTYGYTSPRWVGGRRTRVAFDGVQGSTELMLGYHRAFGPLVVKGFIGGAWEAHRITPFDEENAVSGSRPGLKAALETWLTLGERGFVQTDVSWSQPFHAYNTRLRVGYRMTPAWSAGLEAGAVGNVNYDAGRLGAFLRLESNRGEISLSVGQTGDRGGEPGVYGSVGLLWRF